MKQNNITFNDYKNIGGQTVALFPVRIADNTEGGLVNGRGIINAVDIDWNEAEFKEAIDAQTILDENTVQTATPTITYTSDLIKILAKQQKQIDALIVMVKGLYQGLLSD